MVENSQYCEMTYNSNLRTYWYMRSNISSHVCAAAFRGTSCRPAQRGIASYLTSRRHLVYGNLLQQRVAMLASTLLQLIGTRLPHFVPKRYLSGTLMRTNTAGSWVLDSQRRGCRQSRFHRWAFHPQKACRRARHLTLNRAQKRTLVCPHIHSS